MAIAHVLLTTTSGIWPLASSIALGGLWLDRVVGALEGEGAFVGLRATEAGASDVPGAADPLDPDLLRLLFGISIWAVKFWMGDWDLRLDMGGDGHQAFKLRSYC